MSDSHFKTLRSATDKILAVIALIILFLLTFAVPGNTTEDIQESRLHIVALLPVIYALQIAMFHRKLSALVRLLTFILSINLISILYINLITQSIPVSPELTLYFVISASIGLLYVVLSHPLWSKVLIVLTKKALSIRVNNDITQNLLHNPTLPVNIRKLISSKNISPYVSSILALITAYLISIGNSTYVATSFLLFIINLNNILPKNTYPRSYNVFNPAFKIVQKKHILISLALLSLLVLFFLFSNANSKNYYHDEVIQYQALLGYERHNEFARYDPSSDKFIQNYPRADVLTRLSLFSRNLFGDSVLATKLPVILFAILTYGAIVLIGYSINPLIAVISGYLLLSQPIFLYLGGFFRDYSGLMFFTLVFLISFYYLLNSFTESKFNPKRQILLTMISLLAIFLAYDTGPQILIVIGAIPFTLLYVGIVTKNKHLLCALIGLSLFVGLITALDYLDILKIFYIKHLISTHVTKDVNFDKTIIYMEYLSGQKHWVLSVLLFFWGFAYALVRKNTKLILFASATIISFIVISIFGNRYEDFRYISFIIPAYTIFMGYSYFTFFTEHIARIKSTTIKPVLLITLSILILLTFRIPNPLITNSYFYKVPAFWEKDDGLMLHRRAVAHEYSPVIDYLNKNADSDDVLVYGGEFDIKNTLPSILYPNRSNSLGYSPLTTEDGNIVYESIKSLVSSEREKTSIIYIMLSYPHLNGKEDLMFLQQNCANLGTTLKLLRFNYTDAYRSIPYATWPTLYQCMNL